MSVSVFISYAREDQAFVRRLFVALAEHQIEPWVDWKDIPYSAEWMLEIYRGIESADAFVFVISPDSIASPNCWREIDHAVAKRKHIVPVQYHDPKDDTSVPPEIASLNWLPFHESDDFSKAFADLLKTINTDLNWERASRQLLVRAEEWDKACRNTSLLLRGSKLRDDETWLRNSSPEQKSRLIQLQNDYIGSSRQEENAQQRRLITYGVIALALMAVATVIALVQTGAAMNAEATAKSNLGLALDARATATTNLGVALEAQATSTMRLGETIAANATAVTQSERQLATQAQLLLPDNLARGLLVSAQLNNETSIFEARNSLLNAVEYNPQLSMFLRDHSDYVDCLAFSPDGKLLATGGAREAILRDAKTGKRMLYLANSQWVTSIAFSPDGTLLVWGTSDGLIQFWDVVKQEWADSVDNGHAGQHLDHVTSIAFSPDGATLASASLNGTVRIWNVQSRQPIGLPLSVSSKSVSSVVFSPDGKLLAWTGVEDGIVLWDVTQNEQSGPPLSGQTADSIAFTPDGKILASGSRSGAVILLDLATRSPIGQPLYGHTDGVTSIAISPDSTLLASASFDRTIIIWDIATHSRIGAPLSGHQDFINSVAFSPQGNRMASVSDDYTVILWDVGATSRTSQLLGNQGAAVLSVAVDPSSKILASGGSDGSILLWDMDTLQRLDQLSFTNSSAVNSLAFSPDGELLVAGMDDGSLLLWNVVTKDPDGQLLLGHTGAVNSVAFSPDGSLIASGSDDKSIILWHVESRTQVGQPLSGHDGLVHSVAFSPDSNRVASGSADGSVMLWRVDTHALLKKLVHAESESVAGVAFDATGNSLTSMVVPSGAVTLHAFLLIFWDLTSPSPEPSPVAGPDMSVFNDSTYRLALSPHGQFLATVSADSLIVIWDAISRTRFDQTLLADEWAVRSISFSPDGKWLASGGSEGHVVLWPASVAGWQAQACRVANRNLTLAEWNESFGPAIVYERTCHDLPPGAGIPEPTPTAVSYK